MSATATQEATITTNSSGVDFIGNVLDWDVGQVVKWANDEKLQRVVPLLEEEEIDGKALLLLNERDLEGKITIGLRKNLLLNIRHLHRTCNYATLDFLGLLDVPVNAHPLDHHHHNPHDLGFNGNAGHHPQHHHQYGSGGSGGSGGDIDRISPASSTIGGVAGGALVDYKPEVFKTFVSVAYAFLVTWITAFVMVVVHERVPDMKKYPPLPDIFLDNVPHIPWAFNMCEVTGTILFLIWVFVLIVHKHRVILLRRFFALGGTVFLLRCVTMLITSLSVPGTHLQCTSDDHKFSEDSTITLVEAILLRVQRAYTIWSGLGMSIQGVRTCGDYMFSGHTVSLTLLNFFVTEYTPRRMYFLHTITWLLNMFGIFFILAAHEHYSIDVFVAFYISSRLFLYYHTLANNHALMSHDSNRTRVWFPMFSYFEECVRGMVPNEYDTLGDVVRSCGSMIGEMLWGLVTLKDLFMLTARRSQLEQSIRAKLAASRKSSSNSNNNDTTHKDLNRIDERAVIAKKD